MFVWCKFPEDYLKTIETIWSRTGLHANVYILILVYLLALSAKLFIDVQILTNISRVILCTEWWEGPRATLDVVVSRKVSVGAWCRPHTVRCEARSLVTGDLLRGRNGEVAIDIRWRERKGREEDRRKSAQFLTLNVS